MARKSETEVLVVGAGPVGLITALQLRHQDIDVRLIDRGYWTSKESYGLALHPPTLRLLAELGVDKPLLEDGLKISQLILHLDGKRVYTHDLAASGGEPGYLLVAAQQRLELALVEALRTEGVTVGWNQELLELDSPEEEAEAVVSHLGDVATGYGVSDLARVEQERETVRARTVIGADGYGSTVRQRLGIPARRYHAPVNYEVFEVEAEASSLPDSMNVFVGSGGSSAVLWPMPGGVCRWSFEMPAAEAQDLTVSRLRQLIQEHAPNHMPELHNLRWAASVSFAQHLAESLHRGASWLAGDAVHQTLPYAVQSLNAGLQEGYRLAKALDWGTGSRRAGLLDDYEREVHGEWEALLSLSPLLPATAGLDPALRNRLADLVAALPATGEPLIESARAMITALKQPAANP